MTKAQEAQHLERIIRECPPGYLHDMLLHLYPQFLADLKSDFITFPDIRGYLDQVRIKEKELEALGQKITERRAELAKTEERLKDNRRALEDCHASLKNLSEYLGSAAGLTQARISAIKFP